MKEQMEDQAIDIGELQNNMNLPAPGMINVGELSEKAGQAIGGDTGLKF